MEKDGGGEDDPGPATGSGPSQLSRLPAATLMGLPQPALVGVYPLQDRGVSMEMEMASCLSHPDHSLWVSDAIPSSDSGGQAWGLTWIFPCTQQPSL